MNFQMSPKAKEGRYQDAVLQHGWGTLLIIHIHSFWVIPSISHHSQWQLHAWTTSNCSVPDIWASSFHKLGKKKKKIDYCNLGTVSVLSFRILLACVQLLQLISRGGTEMAFLFWIPKHHMSSKSDTSKASNGLVLSTTSHISWMCWIIVRELLLATANSPVRPCLQKRKLF